MAFVLRQAAAQQPQPALPHFDGQGASRGQELGALAALQVADPQRLRGSGLRTGVSQRVEHKHHAQTRGEEDDPTVGTKKERWTEANHLMDVLPDGIQNLRGTNAAQEDAKSKLDCYDLPNEHNHNIHSATKLVADRMEERHLVGGEEVRVPS